MPPLLPVTQALLLINVALFCIAEALGPTMTYLLALWPLGSPNFMPWQIVSYGFMHQNTTHLLLNMMGIWMFGSDLERLWGPKRYIQFYGASILAAAATQLLVAAGTGMLYPTVGASGGLFGLLMAYGMVFPKRIVVLMIPPMPVKARTLVLIYGSIELLQGVLGTQAGVAHFAHLGGMIGGWLVLRYWRGDPPFSRGPRKPRSPRQF